MATSSAMDDPENKTPTDDEAKVRVKKTIAEVCNEEGGKEYQKGEYKHAVVCYTEGINSKCNDGTLNAKLLTNRAIVYFRLSKYHEALRDAERAVREFQPKYMKAIEIGATACAKLDRFEEAVTWCCEGLDNDQENTSLLEIRDRAVKAKDKPQETKENLSETGTQEDKQLIRHVNLQRLLDLEDVPSILFSCSLCVGHKHRDVTNECQEIFIYPYH